MSAALRARACWLLCAASFGFMLGLVGLPASADDVPDPIPPFLSEGVAPNLVITLDDSESMFNGDAPNVIDQLKTALGLTPGFGLFYMSPDINRLYFDPAKAQAGLYKPGAQYDGTALPEAYDLTAVIRYPFATSIPDGCSTDSLTINLLASYEPILDDDIRCDPVTLRDYLTTLPTCDDGRHCPIYTQFKQNNGYKLKLPPVALDESPYEACIPTDADVACKRCGDYHGDHGDERTPDLCFQFLEVPDDLLPQFGNWYSYYRTRLLMAQTVLSQVMQTLSDNVRITYQGVGKREDLLPADPGFMELTSRFGRYSSIRQAFYQWMFDRVPDSDSTYLVAAQIRAGEFSRQGVALKDDLSKAAGAANSCGVKCRHNFHLLITDGAWGDQWGQMCVERHGTAICSPARWPVTSTDDGTWIANNQDGTDWRAGEFPTTADSPFGKIDYDTSKSNTRPYRDDSIGMLADAAFYYWRTDLYGDASDDKVPPLINSVEPGSDIYDEVNFWNPRNDPANWQHLTLFTVGVAVTGAVTPTADGSTPFGTYEADSISTVADDGFPSCASAPPYEDLGLTECTAVNDGGRLWLQIPEAAKVDDLYHAAINARGGYFNASDPENLLRDLSAVLDTVSAAAEPETANAPVAISAGGLSDQTRVYQAVSNAEKWTGEVRAFQMSLGGTDTRDACSGVARGALCESADNPFQTTTASGSFPDASARHIYTLAEGNADNTGGAVSFNSSMFAQLSDRQKEGLTGRSNPTAAVASAYIEWLRGDDSPTIPDGEDLAFRERDGLMGDILGSGPILVAPPRQLFSDTSYAAFRRDHSDRENMVYVGANDGMLHAFNADSSAPKLEEVFAYVPAAVYDNLATLADPAYNATMKQAYVDGPLSYSDAKIGSGDEPWRSVLVGSFGRGAQGVFALDITDPVSVVSSSSAPAEDLVLWEFTDASGEVNDDGEFVSDADGGALDGRDMGYSPWRPAIVQIDDNTGDSTAPTWVALVGNGYGSTSTEGEDQNNCVDGDSTTNCTVSQSGDAVLYVLRLGGSDDQRIMARIDTGVGTDEDPAKDGRTNALAEISTLDEDGDLIADRAYAGDAFGNVWRFDLKDLSQSPTRIFRAVDRDGNPQPISTRIVFTRHPNGGYVVLFGTGRFINTDDKSDTSVQTFYGIWDDDGLVYPADGEGGGYSEPTRADLIQHEFVAEVNVQRNETDVTAYASRARTSTTDADPASKPTGAVRGWYIDLILKDADPEGERVVVAPQVWRGRVMFVSMIPGDCCSAGGTSWINALDALDGSRLGYTPFDFNLDGSLDVHDLLDVDNNPDTPAVVGSSIQLTSDGGKGIASALTTQSLGGGEAEVVLNYTNGEDPEHPPIGSGTGPRRTWLQLE